MSVPKVLRNPGPPCLCVTDDPSFRRDGHPWPEARRRLAEGRTYWPATTRPGGRPHIMPLLAVWDARK